MTHSIPFSCPYEVVMSTQITLTPEQLTGLSRLKPLAVALIRKYGVTACQHSFSRGRTGLRFQFPPEANMFLTCDEFNQLFDAPRGMVELHFDGTLYELTFDRPPRYTCIDQVAAAHRLGVCCAIPESSAAVDGWTKELATAKQAVGDKPVSTQERERMLLSLLADILHGIDTQCQDHPGCYHFVTDITVKYDEGQIWAFVYLK